MWLEWRTNGFPKRLTYTKLFKIAKQTSPAVRTSVYISNLVVEGAGPSADLETEAWLGKTSKRQNNFVPVLPWIRSLKCSIRGRTQIHLRVLEQVLESSLQIESVQFRDTSAFEMQDQPTLFLRPVPSSPRHSHVAQPSLVTMFFKMPRDTGFLRKWSLAGGSTKLHTLNLYTANCFTMFVAACPATALPALRSVCLACTSQQDLDENEDHLTSIIGLESIHLSGLDFDMPREWLAAQRDTLTKLTISRLPQSSPAEQTQDIVWLSASLPHLSALSFPLSPSNDFLEENLEAFAGMLRLRHLTVVLHRGSDLSESMHYAELGPGQTIHEVIREKVMTAFVKISHLLVLPDLAKDKFLSGILELDPATNLEPTNSRMITEISELARGCINTRKKGYWLETMKLTTLTRFWQRQIA